MGWLVTGWGVIVGGVSVLGVSGCFGENKEREGKGTGWERLASHWSPGVRRAERELAEVQARLSLLPRAPEHQNQGLCLGYHSEFSNVAEVSKQVTMELSKVEAIESVVLVPAFLPGMPEGIESYGFPKQFRIEVSEDERFEHSSVLAEVQGSDFPDPGVLPVAYAGNGVSGRFVRLSVQKLNGPAQRHFFALGELYVFGSGGRCLSSGYPNERVTVTDSFGSRPTWAKKNIADGVTGLGAAISGERSGTDGWRAASAPQDNVEAWVMLDLGKEVDVEEVRVHPAHPADTPKGTAYAFPRRFVIEGDTDPTFPKPRRWFDSGSGDYPAPGNHPICARGGGGAVRWVRIGVRSFREVKARYECAFSEIEVFSGGRNVALGAAVSASSSVEQGRWGAAALTDGFNSEFRLVDLREWLQGLSARREWESVARQRAAWLERRREQFGSWMEGSLAVLALGGVVGGGGMWWRARWARKEDLRVLRERIARDLHDEIGSNLGTIAMLSQMSMEGEADDAEMRADLREIGVLASHSVDAIRDLVWLLKQEGAARAELILEMRMTAQTLLPGVDCVFEAEETRLPEQLPFDVRRNLFLAYKEILHNVAKHAHARTVQIQLDYGVARLGLRVRDDGKGFAVDAVKRGVGLYSLEARAQSAGGMVRFESAPGKGTTVHFELPMNPKRMGLR